MKKSRKTKRDVRPRGSTPLRQPPSEESADAFDWDPTRPLREQWPWNGAAAAPQLEHEDLLGDVELELVAGAEPEQGVEVAVEAGPDADPDDEAPAISAGYDGQGRCDSCGREIFDGEDVRVWETVVSHVDCPIDVPAQPDEYAPGGEVCIADDITECECRRCAAADEQWERDQGWHGDGGGDNDPDLDDCDPPLVDDDAISDIDTADAIEAQDQPGAFDELNDEPAETEPARGEP